MNPLNSTSTTQFRATGAMLMKFAKPEGGPQPPASDTVQISQSSHQDSLKESTVGDKPNYGFALKKMAKAGAFAAVGAATMGVATACCGLGMLLSHNGTQGDNGLLLKAGVGLGAVAGLAAGVFTGSSLVGLAAFGGISQGMIGLTDWAAS